MSDESFTSSCISITFSVTATSYMLLTVCPVSDSSSEKQPHRSTVKAAYHDACIFCEASTSCDHSHYYKSKGGSHVKLYARAKSMWGGGQEGMWIKHRTQTAVHVQCEPKSL